MEKASGNYFNQTRNVLYSYLIALPLLICYEVLILLSQPIAGQNVRISVDIWFKTIFQSLGVHALSATLLLAAVFGAVILFIRREKLPKIRKRYFGFMLLESIIYAVLVTFLIVGMLDTILNLSADAGLESLSKLQLFALSLGAGLYEELFFRVILVSGLFFLIHTIFSSKNTSYILASLIAALVFSGVHYVGEFGDSFEFASFLFRFLFGLALNVIYVIRGFGIAAWTHAVYDILVILQI